MYFLLDVFVGYIRLETIYVHCTDGRSSIGRYERCIVFLEKPDKHTCDKIVPSIKEDLFLGRNINNMNGQSKRRTDCTSGPSVEESLNVPTRFFLERNRRKGLRVISPASSPSDYDDSKNDRPEKNCN